MKKRTTYNHKRKIRNAVDPVYLKKLESSIGYGGNPEHKRNPGDFGLTPPVLPRTDKSLCDWVKIFKRNVALKLLKAGVKKGLVSVREQNGFPKNIWAVTDDGFPLEAQLENQEKGTYHGYPMPEDDDFRNEILDRWNKS